MNRVPTAPLLVLALVLTLGAAPALAHSTGYGNAVTAFLTIHTRSTDQGNVSFFTANGEPVANPTINVTPDRPVVLFLYNAANRSYSIHVGGPAANTTESIPPGNQSSLSFHVPPDPPARIPYWAEPAREGELEGVLRVQGVEEGERTTPAGPWLTATGLALAAGAAARRRS